MVPGRRILVGIIGCRTASSNARPTLLSSPRILLDRATTVACGMKIDGPIHRLTLNLREDEFHHTKPNSRAQVSELAKLQQLR